MIECAGVPAGTGMEARTRSCGLSGFMLSTAVGGFLSLSMSFSSPDRVISFARAPNTLKGRVTSLAASAPMWPVANSAP